ncbi:MAG TPA: sigma-70 family RNA polymerase sigma factor [Saprospiraceae bacterium]|nr:sigma-70 family RNA polymerase sigma factor [Saprospiraceae bacterium]
MHKLSVGKGQKFLKKDIFAMIMAQDNNTTQYERVFEEEFLPHIDALYTFAYHLTYNEDDANDLVQDTYMKAYRFIDKYQSGTNAKAWLFKILKNAFINQYRRKSKQPTQVDYEDITSYQEGEDDTNYAGYADLREEMFQSMMGDEVTNAINALPVKFRVAILLCDIEGFTYEEISKILDIPVNTVRTRLHRARKQLKDTLNEYARSLGYGDSGQN